MSPHGSKDASNRRMWLYQIIYKHMCIASTRQVNHLRWLWLAAGKIFGFCKRFKILSVIWTTYKSYPVKGNNRLSYIIYTTISGVLALSIDHSIVKVPLEYPSFSTRRVDIYLWLQYLVSGLNVRGSLEIRKPQYYYSVEIRYSWIWRSPGEVYLL